MERVIVIRQAQFYVFSTDGIYMSIVVWKGFSY